MTDNKYNIELFAVSKETFLFETAYYCFSQFLLTLDLRQVQVFYIPSIDFSPESFIFRHRDGFFHNSMILTVLLIDNVSNTFTKKSFHKKI